ncbi:hypothetical protein B296_00023555 [Ensete ventricosum]|uniref:Uncharacterized protein n=1 Tax=Ensete ventricosum TaxID=4639 RepID=A0A427ANP4_ENSVE|nr:hypothetical protein B296_00023555 [Ensete ventricosum]
MNQEQRYIRGKKKPNLSNLYSTLFMSRTDLILSTRCFEHSYLHGRRTGHRSSLKVLSSVHTLSQLIKGSLLFRSCLRRLDLRAYLKGHTSLDVNSCKGHRGHQTKELKGVFNVCDVHVCREALGQSPGASSAPPPSRSPKGHLKLLRSSTLLSPSVTWRLRAPRQTPPPPHSRCQIAWVWAPPLLHGRSTIGAVDHHPPNVHGRWEREGPLRMVCESHASRS